MNIKKYNPNIIIQNLLDSFYHTILYSSCQKTIFHNIIHKSKKIFEPPIHSLSRYSMQTTHKQIMNKIIRVHDVYRTRADQMSETKRNRKGNKNDNNKQRDFFNQLGDLEAGLTKLAQDMQKSPAMKSKRQYPQIIKHCSQDIQSITRRKESMFKVNQNLLELATQTRDHITLLAKDLKIAGETAFLCCGTDGAKKFKETMDRFNIYAQQWRIVASLEAKDSVENFVSPDYQERNFMFIKEILAKNWPKQTVKVEYKDRQVVKTINTGEPSRLAKANEYLFGINHQSNVAYGLKIYHQQAKRGDATAASFLGQAYEEGLLIPRDLQKAVSFYRSSMNSKQPYGSYKLAIALLKGYLSEKGINRQDIQKAHKILNQITNCDNPCPEALVQLGELYEQGNFRDDQNRLYTVPRDLKKAIECYKRARQMKVPRATNNLGVLYIKNQYLQESNPNSELKTQQNAIQNIKKGKKYLEQAMLQGFSQSFYNLGCLYESGIAGRKDEEQALLYYYNGGLKGDHHSRLKFAYQLMNQTSIMKEQYEQHYRIAHRWLQSIIHQIHIEEQNSLSPYSNSPSHSQYPHSHPLSNPSNPYFSTLSGKKHTTTDKAEALFYLGLMHQFGFGVDKSSKKAFDLYLQSANLEYAGAKNKLGDCYFSGFGTKQNRQLALGCYFESAQAGNTEAMVNLGTIYLNGVSSLVDINYDKAHQFFIRAVENDNSDAMIHLSYMYRAGLGFDKDQEMAKNLLEQAAKKKNSTALYMLKQMGAHFDDRILFHNLDNQFLVGPKKFNVKQIVPICSKIPSH